MEDTPTQFRKNMLLCVRLNTRLLACRCRALFSKLQYLAQCEELLSSEDAREVDLRRIFGATEVRLEEEEEALCVSKAQTGAWLHADARTLVPPLAPNICLRNPNDQRIGTYPACRKTLLDCGSSVWNRSTWTSSWRGLRLRRTNPVTKGPPQMKHDQGSLSSRSANCNDRFKSMMWYFFPCEFVRTRDLACA